MAEPGKLQDRRSSALSRGPACRPALHQRHARSSMKRRSRRLPLSSIRSPFISMTPRRRPRCSAGWRRAAGIRRRSPCACWSSPDCRSCGGIVGAGGEINWPKPTRPGDILQVVSEVEEVVPSRSRPDRGMVKVRSETRNQRGEVVQVLLAKLIVPRRAATSPQPQGELGRPAIRRSAARCARTSGSRQ